MNDEVSVQISFGPATARLIRTRRESGDRRPHHCAMWGPDGSCQSLIGLQYQLHRTNRSGLVDVPYGGLTGPLRIGFLQMHCDVKRWVQIEYTGWSKPPVK